MKHLPFLDLALRHSYYSDGRCPDLRVRPTGATERLLTAHRCIVRPRADGLRISTAVDESGRAIVPFAPNTEFVFHLELDNPDFVLFTDLRELHEHAAPLFTNIGLPEGSGDLVLTGRRQWSSETCSSLDPHQPSDCR